MFVNLEVHSFHCVEGFAHIAASVYEPGVMREVFGTEDCVHAIKQVLLHGPVDAELNGKPIRMRHFVVLNDGNRRRIPMTVRFGERSQQW